MINWKACSWGKVINVSVGLVAFVSMALSVIFYFESRSYQSPTYYISPNRFPILSPEIQVPMEIRLGGEAVKEDYVTAALVSFWNRGRKSIDWDRDVTRQITIHLVSREGESVQLLGAIVYKEPMPDITAFDLQQVDGTAIELHWEVLYKQQGAVIQVVWKGDPKARISVTGLVGGDRKPVNAQRLWNRWRPYIIVLGVLVITLAIIGPVLGQKNRRAMYVVIAVMICFTILMGILVIVMNSSSQLPVPRALL